MKNAVPFGLGFLAGVLYMQYRIRGMQSILPAPPPANNGGYAQLPPEIAPVVPSFPALPAPPTKPMDTWVTTTDNQGNPTGWASAPTVNGVPRRGWNYQQRGSSVPFGSYLPPNA
ncbi:MAG: hypothetical protein ACKV1O_31045 [Saprospiraceae bacterium]